MIIKLSGSGKSFKGLSTYLMHDPNAQTDKRVDWTHTLNLGNDFVPAAVSEMYLTSQNAELLKQQAGVRAGGRESESPVKHVSLSWAPDETPSQEHMVEASEAFLRKMGWHEHQAVLIAHNDKPYKHVHIMLNAVHPETGRHFSESFEKRRASAWARGYENEHGLKCPQRPLEMQHRMKSMPRNIWMEFLPSHRDFYRDEKLLAEQFPESPEDLKNADWKILREFHKKERTDFFKQGKIEFNSLRSEVHRNVKSQFRERWSEYYKAARSAGETGYAGLAETKQALMAEQKDALEQQRDLACCALRASRDIEYRQLLDRQKENRAELRTLQSVGLDTAPFLNALQIEPAPRTDIRAEFQTAAAENLARRQPKETTIPDASVSGENSSAGAPREKSSAGRKVARFGFSLLDALFIDLTNLGSAAAPPRSQEEKEEDFRAAADSAVKQEQKRTREEEDERWRVRQKALYGE